MSVKKESRKSSAVERQTASAGRTPQQQLAHLDSAGLTATKERAKLHKRIEDAKAAPKAAKAK